ncbi:hypothetical protein AAG747_18135 [Rapidithrix thailandica]|uniref:Toxin-antitoxin system YwqK family antitoxin n=1 Tax=Rapidithrix thailandica TaxID=413964 RepID=A0AAW9S3R6_9BACT
MKKFLLILINLLAFTSVHAQLNDLQRDFVKWDKGDGSFKTYYDNGNVQDEFTIRFGKLDGLYKNYYETGELRNTAEMKDGMYHGKRKIFDKEGKPVRVYTFSRDSLIAEEILYYHNNGNKAAQYKWSLYQDGLENLEGDYKQRVRNVWFSETDMVPYAMAYGYHKLYHTNGQLKMEGKMFDNQKVGVWKKYDRNGELVKTDVMESADEIKNKQ